MNTEFARRQMVEQQVRGWNVNDEDVLHMLKNLPREQFVPGAYKELAFAEMEIPLGHGERMMSPMIEGRVLQALGLTGSERVLEIGCGSGFLTACLARLSTHVTSVDIYEDFLQSAANSLSACDIDNVELLQLDAMRELPPGEFDAIAVTGSIQRFDPRFVTALVPGGRLFVVVGNAPAMTAKLVQRTDAHDWQTTSLFETSLKPLVHGALLPQFTF